jgi:hypothetical protein
VRYPSFLGLIGLFCWICFFFGAFPSRVPSLLRRRCVPDTSPKRVEFQTKSESEFQVAFQVPNTSSVKVAFSSRVPKFDPNQVGVGSKSRSKSRSKPSPSWFQVLRGVPLVAFPIQVRSKSKSPSSRYKFCQSSQYKSRSKSRSKSDFFVAFPSWLRSKFPIQVQSRSRSQYKSRSRYKFQILCCVPDTSSVNVAFRTALQAAFQTPSPSRRPRHHRRIVPSHPIQLQVACMYNK